AYLQEGMNRWLQENPPPPGIEMHGMYPIMRGTQFRKEKQDQKISQEEREKQKWYRDWSEAYNQLSMDNEDRRLAQGHTDWRPLLSYSTNLDRFGDLLLDTDGAWVVLGRTVERPREMMRGRDRPPNDRRMADRYSLQFPWYWSAGVLGGLWL